MLGLVEELGGIPAITLRFHGHYESWTPVGDGQGGAALLGAAVHACRCVCCGQRTQGVPDAHLNQPDTFSTPTSMPTAAAAAAARKY